MRMVSIGSYFDPQLIGCLGKSRRCGHDRVGVSPSKVSMTNSHRSSPCRTEEIIEFTYRIWMGVTNRSVSKGLLTGSEMTYRWLCVSAQSHMVALMKAVTLEHSAQLAGSMNGLSVSFLLSWSGSSCCWAFLLIL